MYVTILKTYVVVHVLILKSFSIFLGTYGELVLDPVDTKTCRYAIPYIKCIDPLHIPCVSMVFVCDIHTACCILQIMSTLLIILNKIHRMCKELLIL